MISSRTMVLAHEHMHVTTLKTLLEHTQTHRAMVTISTILYHIAYALFTIFILILLIPILVEDTKTLRDWAMGREEQDQQQESGNPVKGSHI